MAEAAELMKVAKEQMESAPDKALEAARKAESLFNKARDTKQENAAFRLVVLATISTGKVDEAAKMAKSRLELADGSGDKSAKAAAYIVQAEVSLCGHKGEAALKSATHAVSLCKEAGDQHLEAESRLLQGRASILTGARENALVEVMEAYTLYLKVEDREGQAKALHFHATMEKSPATALRASRKAHAIYKSIGDVKGQGLVLKNIAQAELLSNNSKAAMQAAEQSLACFRELGIVAKGQAPALEIIIAVHLANNEPHEALRVASEAVSACKRSGDKEGQAAFLLASMKAHVGLADTIKAVEAAKDARALYNEVGNKAGMAACAERLAEQQFSDHCYEEAIENAQQALLAYEAAGDEKGKSSARIMLTKAFTAKGEPEKAPLRKEALQLLDALVQALRQRDGESFDMYMKDLKSLSGVTDTEISEALATAGRKDPDASKSFLAAHSDAVQSVKKASEGDRIKRMDTLMMYLTFRWAGMGYGPRLRQTKDFMRHGKHGVPTTEAFGITHTQPEGMGERVLPQDWEDKVLLPNAGMMDSVLQGGAAMQYAEQTPQEIVEFFSDLSLKYGLTQQ